MRLTECLNESDIRTLQRIASHCGLDGRSSSKLSLIQEILARLGRREDIRRGAESLPPLIREVVIAVVCGGRDVWSAEDLQAVVRRVFGKGVEWREALIPVMDRGWLFPLRTERSEVLYHVPAEVREGVRTWLRETCRRDLPEVPEPLVWKEEGQALVRDAAVFLAYVERRRPPLTGEGVLYRRHQQQIFDLMEIREKPLEPVTWRFGYGRRFHDYPDRFALIYDFCYAKGLVEERADHLSLGARARSWLARPDAEKWRDLFVFWRYEYRRAIPELPVALIWVSEACAGGWIEESRLDQLLEPYVHGYYYDDAETVKHRRIYAMLVHLGVLCVGTVPDGRRVYRASGSAGDRWADSLPEPSPPESWGLIVQPHFEVLVPPQWAARLVLDLAVFAEPVSGEGLSVYRMSRKSIRAARERGWTGEDVVRWLRRYAAHDVPGHVEVQILQWAKAP
ncbi:MAG: helicase-associated domain-containing protein [Kyrpidia sp.]|nr:helicase-associated domain-containing protein [Kyrpidia sp.]